MKDIKNKILIVDDDPHMRWLLSAVMEESYEVHSVDCVTEAIVWLHKGNRPDVIVCDLRMPNIDGVDFLDTLQESVNWRDIPCIMLSGVNKSEKRIECFEKGASDFLVKPFNPMELQSRIKKLVA